MTFNEDSRVKLPAVLHLCRLGYEYLPLAHAHWDIETNIFKDVFFDAIQALNPAIDSNDIEIIYNKRTLALDNEDLGNKFYELITSETGPKIIDFENFSNNKLQVVTELPCINGDEIVIK